MRKVFWCCLAAGAAVCCAFWAAAYVSQNPDSTLGRVALVASHTTEEHSPQAAHVGGSLAVEADELIPADPVPVDDAPHPPTPGFHLPPEIAGLLTPPPIVINEDVDANPVAAPAAKNGPKAAPVDGGSILSALVKAASASRETGEVSESLKPRVQLIMPYCKDNEAPSMPYCAEDNVVPAMPPAPVEDMDKVSRAARPEFDAFAFWMGFFTAPSQLSFDHTYTAEKPALPGAAESSEPTAAEGHKKVDPMDLFSHSRRLRMPRPPASDSDTMEMRPSDWKPYSLDPGPF